MGESRRSWRARLRSTPWNFGVVSGPCHVVAWRRPAKTGCRIMVLCTIRVRATRVRFPAARQRFRPMHYVYLLRSEQDKKLYVGYSADLRKRFRQHQSGYVRATAPRRPFTLLYYEAYRSEEDARNREHFFKTGWGRNYIKKYLAKTLVA